MAEKRKITADYWSTVNCEDSDKNFYCFPPIRARSCDLIFGEKDASREDWCEYWTVEKFLKDRVPVNKCLSICCGFGVVERIISKLGVAKEIIGTDIAPGAIEQAKLRAKEEKLENINYFVADLNSHVLPKEEYDLIWANGALHHIEHLDRVIGNLYNSLKHDCILVSNEYVGPKYSQIGPRQQELVNAMKHMLPPELRDDSYSYGQPNNFLSKLKKLMPKNNNIIFKQIYRPIPVKWFLKNDPSECIDSPNIIPTLKKYFDEVEVRYFHGSLIYYALDYKFYNNFNFRDDNHRNLLQMLFEIEDYYINSGQLQPDHAHIICKRH